MRNENSAGEVLLNLIALVVFIFLLVGLVNNVGRIAKALEAQGVEACAQKGRTP